MNYNLTVGYMADQINRERLDSVAARGWLAEVAATKRARTTGSTRVLAMCGAVLVRLRELIQGKARPVSRPVDPIALPAR